MMRISSRDILSLLPFSLLIKIQRRNLILPLYHIVSDERIPYVIHRYTYCSINQFKKDLDFLQKYFLPVSLSDLLSNIMGSIALPERSFLLTFDDGYREVAEVIAPILKKRSIPAVFFLNSAFIDNKEMFYRDKAGLIIDKLDNFIQYKNINKISELLKIQNPTLSSIKKSVLGINYHNKGQLDELAQILEIDFIGYLKEKRPYLNSNEIRDLINQGFMVGAHSVDHPLFSEINLEEQLSQVFNSLGKLKEQFDVPYNAFAFPNNDRDVSQEFFNRTHFNGLIDISFGTSDFSNGHCENNLQRQPMEGRPVNAHLIYKQLICQEIIKWTKNKLHFKPMMVSV